MASEKQIIAGMRDSVQKNFRHATLNFLFILLFVNVFQAVFGMENSIVGVIFTILMSASMARDLTNAPVRHLIHQAAVLMLMAAAACYVSNARPIYALPVNLAMLFVILYAYTYEYTSHLYFPYILSYLFLVFISPVPPQQLPKRLLAMLAGAIGIILYQLVNGRKRVAQTARDVLVLLSGRARACVDCLLNGTEMLREPDQVRSDLSRISEIVYERRKRALCISDASFAMIDAGRSTENLILLLYEYQGPLSPSDRAALREIGSQLDLFQAFLRMELGDIPEPSFQETGANGQIRKLCQCVSYIQDCLLKMTQPERRTAYHAAGLSLAVRLKAALKLSPVRFAYAARTSCLLALLTLAVTLLKLPHGKWLLFTAASVSLPYAEDVGLKAKKRMLATLIGGTAGALMFALIPSPDWRTAIMMLSGYLSFYFTDYQATFALSTVGALGGAVYASAYGWGSVGGMLLIRLGYVALGIAIAFAVNVMVFPFRRKEATCRLWRKYQATVALLAQICQSGRADKQLYYTLVIQTHLMEEKLYENAKALNWTGAAELLRRLRESVRAAHRENAGAALSSASTA